MKYKRIYINIIFFLLFILRFIAPQDIKNNQNGSINSKAPFKVLYNNDSTNIYHCISPWHGSKEPINDEMIEKSIEEVSNSSVDAYMFTDGRGWIPFRQSKVYPDHYEWWMKRTGKNPDAFGKYILDGGDMIKTAVNACKKYNMAAFVSYRLNDVHLLEFAETKHSNSIWCSRFYIEHPEYRLYPLESQTYSVKNGQNWAIKEVRDHKFAFIKEICENYDIDGIELDFMRSGMLFRTDQTSEKERIKIINNFVREIRSLLDKTTMHGKRRYLCLRIPHYASIHNDLGINISDLVNLGVDMLILSSHFFTAQKSGYAEIRKTAPETAIYIEMTHVSSDVRFGGGSVVYTSGGPYPRTSDHQFYTTAYKSLMIGYDGVSLFNFVYYRPQSEPPFHILKHLNDLDFLSKQPQYYYLAKWRPLPDVNKMPRYIRRGKPEQFDVEIVLPSVTIKEKGRLRIHTIEQIPEKIKLTALINGIELESTEDISAFYDNPYDKMISSEKYRKAWLFPIKVILNGVNKLEIKINSFRYIDVAFIDFSIE